MCVPRKIWQPLSSSCKIVQHQQMSEDCRKNAEQEGLSQKGAIKKMTFG
jgi:hypothetical protein